MTDVFREINTKLKGGGCNYGSYTPDKSPSNLAVGDLEVGVKFQSFPSSKYSPFPMLFFCLYQHVCSLMHRV